MECARYNVCALNKTKPINSFKINKLMFYHLKTKHMIYIKLDINTELLARLKVVILCNDVTMSPHECRVITKDCIATHKLCLKQPTCSAGQ